MKLNRIVCIGLVLLAGSAAAQQGGDGHSARPRSVSARRRRAAASRSMAMPLREVMNAADPALAIAPRNTKGSNENIPLLEQGELDIALVAGEPSYEAFMGIGRPPTRLKILTAMYSSAGLFVVRADSPYRTIRDLVGQPVAFGAKGSGLPILSRYMLDGLGLKQDRGFQVDLSRSRRRWPGDGARRPRRGAVGRRHRLARICGGRRQSRRRALHRARCRARSRRSGPSTLPQAADGAGRQLSRTRARRSTSVGSWSFVLVRETLPDDVAYRLAKTLHGARRRCARPWRRPARPRRRTPSRRRRAWS